MKKIIFGLACLCLAGPLLSQSEGRLAPLSQWLDQQIGAVDVVPVVRPLVGPPQKRSHATGTLYTFDLSAKTLAKIASEGYPALEIEIPMPDGSVALLQLARHELLSDDFVLLAAVAGQSWGPHYLPALHYRGLSRGDGTTGLAAVSVSKNCLRAVFEWQDQTWNLGPERNNPLSGQYVLYAEEEVTLPLEFVCFSETRPEADRAHVIDGATTTRSPLENCVRVHAVANYGLYQRLNASIQETADYVAFMYNVVSAIYFLEQIRTVLSQIEIWTTPDPYAADDSRSALRSFGASLQNAVGGDLAHLLANYSDSLGNNLGGRAWLDVLCDTFHMVDSSGPYAYSNVSSSFAELPTYSWDVNVVAHEMGHNLGAPHTHACVWNADSTQIDDCGNVWLTTNNEDDDGDGTVDNVEEASACFDTTNVILPTSGTIMSYCHTIPGVGVDLTLGFDTQVGDVMRDAVAAAACLAPCDALCHATLHLFDPITQSADLEADQYILAQNEVSLDSGTVDYDAGQYIILKPGFHARVDTGAIFHAFIDGCGNLRPGFEGNPPLQLAHTIELHRAARIRLRPNPADVTAQLDIQILSTEVPIGFYLTDRLGQVVRIVEDPRYWQAGTHTRYVNTAELPTGLYFLVGISSEGRQAIPLLIAH